MKSIIVGSVPITDEKSILIEKIAAVRNNGGIAIAADAGVLFFMENDIAPDCFIGDMDSLDEKITKDILRERYPHMVIETCSPIKDDTDMALAVEYAVKSGSRSIEIFGGIGGKRLSHMQANIQLMHNYAMKGIEVSMHNADTDMYIISEGMNKRMTFDESFEGSISIFSLSDKAKGVKISGLKYEYEGELSNEVSLGVSNSFIGKEATVEAEQGALLLMLEK